MGRKRRVSKRRADLTDEQAAWLRGDYRNAGFTNYVGDEELSELWNRYCDAIIADYAQEYPGFRPGRWWKYTAPEMRKRVGGIGTPCHEVLEYSRSFKYGLPVDWITPWQVEFYSRPTPDNYGNFAKPITPGHFNGVAIDPNDPPVYESQAAYLKRHGLFMPGERKQLTAADFEPEALTSAF